MSLEVIHYIGSLFLLPYHVLACCWDLVFFSFKFCIVGILVFFVMLLLVVVNITCQTCLLHFIMIIQGGPKKVSHYRESS